jgi:hypothetical protein
MTRVIPSMLLVLVLSWTITVGILKGWTFLLVLVAIFITCYLAHKV